MVKHRWKRFKAGLAHAFAYDDGREEMTPEDIALLDRVAALVVRRRLTLGAILLLESTGPLNFVGSSLMSFFRPIVGIAFRLNEYERFERLLERRCALGLLVERIELAEARWKEGQKAKGGPGTLRRALNAVVLRARRFRTGWRARRRRADGAGPRPGVSRRSPGAEAGRRG